MSRRLLHCDLGQQLAETLQQRLIAELGRPLTVALLTCSGKAMGSEWKIEVYGEFDASEVVQMEEIARAHGCGCGLEARPSDPLHTTGHPKVAAFFYELSPSGEG